MDCEENHSDKTKPPVDVSLGRGHRSSPARVAKLEGPREPRSQLCPFSGFAASTVVPARRLLLQGVQAAAALAPALQAAPRGCGAGRSVFLNREDAFLIQEESLSREVRRAVAAAGRGPAAAASELGSTA